MNYIYQRTGGPILRWDHGAPRQSQAADARSLGHVSVFAPGSPEPLTDVGSGVSLLVKLAVLAGVLWIGGKIFGKKKHAAPRSNPARSRYHRRHRSRRRR